METMSCRIDVHKTPHGLLRAAQRGVSDETLFIIIRYGSFKYHRGRLIYYLRHSDLEDLVENEVIDRQGGDKLINLFVIAGGDDRIVTVYHPTKTKRRRFKWY